MEVLGFFVLIVWLLVIPVCIGGIPAAFVDKQGKSPAFMGITGYMLMWAVFQIICVPCVLLEEKFKGMFPYVVYGFGGAALLLAVTGGVLFVRRQALPDRVCTVIVAFKFLQLQRIGNIHGLYLSVRYKKA